MKYLNSLFDISFFPNVLKYITLVFFIGLIVIGFTASSSDAETLKYLRNTNLASLIVWSYWWPLIIAFSIFLGRIWCMVCPIELVTSLFASIGLRKRRPKWLLSGWTITIFYIIILFVGIQGFAIHRNPSYMAIYLIILLAVSIVVGSLFEKNTFCRYVCPVGYILGIYSRLSFVGWRVKNKDVCKSCTDKSCIKKTYIYNYNSKSCGVDLYPARIVNNSDCILCGGCRKTCGKHNTSNVVERPNPQFQKIGFASDLFKLQSLKIAEIAFVLIVSGFVIYEICVEWKISKQILLLAPTSINTYFSFDNPVIMGMVKSVSIFVILPIIIWLIPYLISRLVGSSIRFYDYLRYYGLSFIPIMAAAHLAKAVLKTTSRLPYFNIIGEDITGVTTANKLVNNQLGLELMSTTMTYVITISLFVLMVAGIMLSIRIIMKLNRKRGNQKTDVSFYLIPAIYGGFFLFLISIWRI